jgi:hypothetical protein
MSSPTDDDRLEQRLHDYDAGYARGRDDGFWSGLSVGAGLGMALCAALVWWLA